LLDHSVHRAHRHVVRSPCVKSGLGEFGFEAGDDAAGRVCAGGEMANEIVLMHL